MGILNKIFFQKLTTELKEYHNLKKYSINYPKNWIIKKIKEGEVSIISNKNKGGVFIFGYKKSVLTDEIMSDFFLTYNNFPVGLKQSILNNEKSEIKSWYSFHHDIANNMKCLTLYKIEGANFWVITGKIKSKLWKKGWKEIIEKILASFKIK